MIASGDAWAFNGDIGRKPMPNSMLRWTKNRKTCLLVVLMVQRYSAASMLFNTARPGPRIARGFFSMLHAITLKKTLKRPFFLALSRNTRLPVLHCWHNFVTIFPGYYLLTSTLSQLSQVVQNGKLCTRHSFVQRRMGATWTGMFSRNHTENTVLGGSDSSCPPFILFRISLFIF